MKVFVSLGHLLRGTYQSMCTHTPTHTHTHTALLQPVNNVGGSTSTTPGGQYCAFISFKNGGMFSFFCPSDTEVNESLNIRVDALCRLRSSPGVGGDGQCLLVWSAGGSVSAARRQVNGHVARGNPPNSRLFATRRDDALHRLSLSLSLSRPFTSAPMRRPRRTS